MPIRSEAPARSDTLDRADRVLAELGYPAVFIHANSHRPQTLVHDRFPRLDRFDCIHFPPRGGGIQ